MRLAPLCVKCRHPTIGLVPITKSDVPLSLGIGNEAKLWTSSPWDNGGKEGSKPALVSRTVPRIFLCPCSSISARSQRLEIAYALSRVEKYRPQHLDELVSHKEIVGTSECMQSSHETARRVHIAIIHLCTLHLYSRSQTLPTNPSARSLSVLHA